MPQNGNDFSLCRYYTKPPSAHDPILLIFGGAVFGARGGLHAVYTFLDLSKPRRPVPADSAVAQAMASSGLRLSGGATDMWRAWVGFNFSHSLGLLILGGLAIGAGLRVKTLPAASMLALVLIGCVCLVLSLLYWFRIPSIGVAIGTACFGVAWILSLI